MRPAAGQMCGSWKPARSGAPGVWPGGGGRGSRFVGLAQSPEHSAAPFVPGRPARPPRGTFVPCRPTASSPGLGARGPPGPAGPGASNPSGGARQCPPSASPASAPPSAPGLDLSDPAPAPRGRLGRRKGAPEHCCGRCLGLKGGRRGAILHGPWRLGTQRCREAHQYPERGRVGRVLWLDG